MEAKNIYTKEKWFEIVYKILVEHGYKSGFTLCPKSWGELYEMGMHPVKAICTMEGLPNIRVSICYNRILYPD